MLKNRLKIIYTSAFLFLAFAQQAYAGFLDDAGLSADCAKGRCSLNDVVLGFISLIRLLLGAIAAIALVFLVWGGVQWVWSGGNADKVKRGKDIFFNTIAALVLAFGSYMITAFFINDILLGGNTGGNYAQYRVSSEGSVAGQCVGQDIGTACNAPQANFVCSGPDHSEVCVLKCTLAGMVFRSELESTGIAIRCIGADKMIDLAQAAGGQVGFVMPNQACSIDSSANIERLTYDLGGFEACAYFLPNGQTIIDPDNPVGWFALGESMETFLNGL